MQRTDLSFQQIYNQLLAGSKLVLHFPDATSAETFRTRLHHLKTKQEKTFVGLGLAVEDERTVLKFRTEEGKEGEGVVAYIQFAAPSPLKKYPVLILEEKDLQGGETEVSTTLGTT